MLPSESLESFLQSFVVRYVLQSIPSPHGVLRCGRRGRRRCCAARHNHRFHLRYMFHCHHNWLSLSFLLVCGGVGFGIFKICYPKIGRRQTTSFLELTHQRELPFNLVNVLLDDFVLLWKMDFCRAQIERGALLRQIDFAGSPRINLIQTNSGFLRKLFITYACAFQSAKHSHCFVLYLHSSSSMLSISANTSAAVFILRFFLFILTLIIFYWRACCICCSIAAQIRSLSRRFSSSASRWAETIAVTSSWKGL